MAELDGYSQDFNRGDNEGSAFVLGPNEALGDLRDHVKGVLADIARNRIRNQAALNKIGSDSMKGALDSDIYKYILPAKQNLTSSVANFSQKTNIDRNYPNTPEGLKEAQNIKEQQDVYSAMIASSVNRKTISDQAITKYDTGEYEDDSLAEMAKYRQAHPLSPGGTGALTLNKKFDYNAFTKKAVDALPEYTHEQQNGLTVTTEENKMVDANGKQTEYGIKVNDKVDSMLATDEGKQAIERKRRALGLPKTDEGFQEATAAVKSDIFPKKSAYKQIEKRAPTDREQDMADQAKSITYDVPIKFTNSAGKEKSWTADLFASHNAKKAKITVPAVEGMYDMSTGLPYKPGSSTIDIVPSGTAGGAIQTFTGKGLEKTEAKNLYEVSTVIEYKPKDREVAIAELAKAGAIEEPDENNKFSDADEQTIDAKMERDNKLQRKSILVPFAPIKGTLQQNNINTDAIDEKWNQLRKKSNGTTAPNKKSAPTEVKRKTPDGKIAIFDATTKEFIRYE